MDENALLKDLREKIESRQVLCIVGAGVSIAASASTKVASWKGLLEHGVDWTMQVIQPPPSSKWRDSVTTDLEAGETDLLVSAAEKISSKLGAPRGPEYANWLRESIGTLRATDRTLIEAIASLGVPIATTNYDSLLEEVTGLPAITARDPGDVERVVRGAESGIIHLHGWWKHPETVVLGIRSYERVLTNAHAQAILRALAITKTLLFIGFGAGLDDPNFSALAAWASTVLSDSPYRRYRLAKNNEKFSLPTSALADPRLYTLNYGESHADLPDFIRSLAPKARTHTASHGMRKSSPEADTAVSSVTAELLTHLHSPYVPLAKCLAEALALAVRTKNGALEEFCRGELDGWSFSEGDEAAETRFSYRVVDVFVLLKGELNVNFPGWGGKEDRIFAYMESDPDTFKKLRWLLHFSVPHLESKPHKGADLAVTVFKFPANLLIPTTKYKGDVRAYARSDVISDVLTRIRSELTKRLLSMLPVTTTK